MSKRNAACISVLRNKFRQVTCLKSFESTSFSPHPFSLDAEPIFALMVTGKDASRIPLAKNSIQSFCCQSYPNRHLIIVTDSRFKPDICSIPSTHVQVFEAPTNLTLGELRNLALCQVPQESFFIQWDDDDWHSADYIRSQYQFLLESRIDGCAPGSQIKYSFLHNTGWKHTLPPGFLGFAGAIFARRKGDVMYPASTAHEDTSFWGTYIAKYRVARWDCASDSLYIRMIHGRNTSSHLLVGCLQPCLWGMDVAAAQYLSLVLRLYGVTGDVLAAATVLPGLCVEAP
jgi:hypothetical protein